MAEQDPISVYLVDDVPELRELVKYAMEDDPRFEVVGEAGDGRAAAPGLSGHAIGLPAALVDMADPGGAHLAPGR